MLRYRKLNKRSRWRIILQIRIIGNQVQNLSSPAAVMMSKPSLCHWETGKARACVDSEPEDLPLLCTDTPQGLGEYVLK